MTDPASSAVPWPIDPRIREQLGRVRWRRRVREAQRVGFVLAGTTGLAAAGLVVAALRATTVTFAATAAAAVLGLAGVGMVLVFRAWRGRVPGGRLALWIDEGAGLGGALATLIELRAPRALGPLLAERNALLLEAWRPERLVPDVVPPGPLAALGAGAAALALALRLAPHLLPAAPEVVVSEHPLAAVDARGLPRRPDRLVVGPDGGGVSGPGVPGDGRPAPAVADAGGPPGLPMTWAHAVQERLRQQLWGRDWDRLREALARADMRAATRPGEPPRREAARRTRPGAGAADDGERADATATRGARRVAGGEGARADAGAPDDGGPATADAGGSGAPGAGPGTDPNVLGAPQPDIHTGADPFALAMAARVRTRRAGARPPTGETPPAPADEQPSLAQTPRREDPVHRMAVPPEWEPVICALFARGERTP